MRWNYIIIPAAVAGVSVIGSWLTSLGMDGWYEQLSRPAWTPPGSIIGAVWTTIFILAAVSALVWWNRTQRDFIRRAVLTAFIANAVLNIGWSAVFFALQLIEAAVAVAALLAFSVAILMYLLWPISRLSSVLLAPYVGWVVFATYLNYIIVTMN